MHDSQKKKKKEKKKASLRNWGKNVVNGQKCDQEVISKYKFLHRSFFKTIHLAF